MSENTRNTFRTSDIGKPPRGIQLRPENCSDVWPEFVRKHGLRQLDGEQVSDYLSRFCRNVNRFPGDWEYFSCPKTAQALFCLAGFRNIWLRSIVDRACQTPNTIEEIKTCLIELIPYIKIGLLERRTRARRVKKGLPRKKTLETYPWQYMRYPPTADTILRVSLQVWNLRPLKEGEWQIIEPLLLS